MSFLKGKTAIITGAGRAVLEDGRCGSIGYGIATAYAKEGENLVITGRNVKKLEDAKDELENLYGVRVLPVRIFLNDEQDERIVYLNASKTAGFPAVGSEVKLSCFGRHIREVVAL